MIMRAPTPETRKSLHRYAARYRWDAARVEKAMLARGFTD